MKKCIFYLLMILSITIVIYFLNTKHNQNKMKIEITFVDEILPSTSDCKIIKFCAVDNYNNYDLINLEVPLDVEDIYVYIFELYNQRRNSLPVNYNSACTTVFEWSYLEKNEDKILVVVKNDVIDDDELQYFGNALLYTYRMLDINVLEINIGDKIYTFSSKLSK